MGERISDEVYECAGCAGEVPVVDAVWLPEPRPFEVDASKARPYCCRECFEAHQSTAAQERAAADLRREAETALKAEARQVARTLVVTSGEDCIGIGSYEPGIATIVQLDADGVKRRARTAESWVAYIADALYKFATRPRPAPQPATGDGVREEVVSELSRAIHLIDHEDQAATREARDLLIRLKALLTPSPGGAGVVGNVALHEAYGLDVGGMPLARPACARREEVRP